MSRDRSCNKKRICPDIPWDKFFILLPTLYEIHCVMESDPIVELCISVFFPLKVQNYPREDYESIITPREDYGSIITPLDEC